MQPLISVIIPVYNRISVLEECVESVRSQSWRNLEILLIDDGSTDGSDKLCTKLAEKDERIRVLLKTHKGVSAARNAGLDAAVGEYLFFVDSDDVIHPRLLDALCSGMKRNDAGIGGTDLINVSEKYWSQVEKAVALDQSEADVECNNWEDALNASMREQTPLNQIGGVMIQKTLMGTTRFREDLFIGEDFYFIYENLLKGGRVLLLKPKWYYCRLHANNSSWNYSYEGFWTRFYRRQLVWEQEEILGRPENAAIQKRQAYGFFIYCQKKNSWNSSDSIRMRKTMRRYTKQFFSALSISEKMKYLVALYLPRTYQLMLQIKKKLKPKSRITGQ